MRRPPPTPTADPRPARPARQARVVLRAGAAAQERHRLLSGQHVEPQRGGVAAPGRPAGGDQHDAHPRPAAATRRAGRVARRCRRSAASVPGHAAGRTAPFTVSAWSAAAGHAQPLGQRWPGRRRGGGLLGRHPPDHVVVAAEPVGVLKCQLRSCRPRPARAPPRPAPPPPPPRPAGRRATAAAAPSAAGEVAVARGQVAHLRAQPREPLSVASRRGRRAGKCRRYRSRPASCRPRPAAAAARSSRRGRPGRCTPGWPATPAARTAAPAPGPATPARRSGSLANAARHSASPNRDPKYAGDSTAIVRAALVDCQPASCARSRCPVGKSRACTMSCSRPAPARPRSTPPTARSPRCS